MRKMLAVVGSFLLCGTAWAAQDRSVLSFQENTIINTACAPTVPEGNSAFQSCVAAQMEALALHPTPDRSGLSPTRARAVELECNYLRRRGIGVYNDCVAKAIAAPVKTTEKTPVDELVPNFGKVFTEEAANNTNPQPVQVAAATTLPGPADALPARPDHLDQQILAPNDLFKRVQSSVFVVVATQSFAEARARNASQGSAIAVSDHLLLTNCHVVKDRPLIKLIQDGKRANATLVGGDYATDRCVLKTDELTLTPVNGVRTVESVGIGEHVFAIGAPLSFELTLSDGMISGVRHGSGRNLVQTTAAVGHGSSGGGLFDDRGNLIGITTLMFGATGLAENLNFAIAASDFWK
jgi:S1-C subfamily serine protease